MQRALAIVIVLWMAGIARAETVEPPPPAGAPVAPAIHRAAVTFGPILLVLPVLEVNAELAVSPKLGVEGILGAGKETPKTSDGSASGPSVSVYEVGMSGRYYAIGNFDTGLQLGVQALFIKASAASGLTTAVANGLGISPFVGYKHTFHPGFVIELEGGVTFVAYNASASDGSTASQKKVLALLRVNLGWAF